MSSSVCHVSSSGAVPTASALVNSFYSGFAMARTKEEQAKLTLCLPVWRVCPYRGCENQWTACALRAEAISELCSTAGRKGGSVRCAMVSSMKVTVQSAGTGRDIHLPGCQKISQPTCPTCPSAGQFLRCIVVPKSKMNSFSCNISPLPFPL